MIAPWSRLEAAARRPGGRTVDGGLLTPAGRRPDQLIPYHSLTWSRGANSPRAIWGTRSDSGPTEITNRDGARPVTTSEYVPVTAGAEYWLRNIRSYGAGPSTCRMLGDRTEALPSGAISMTIGSLPVLSVVSGAWFGIA